MGKVTPQSVTIKKSPRSTMDLSRTKSGSARIGDLNVVEHLMLQPSDMARISVDTSILFVSPLNVPAFARMKVFTYYFFDAYQNVCDQFNDVIQNYTHEVKTELANGQIETKSGYYLPWVTSVQLSNYLLTGLHWLAPVDTAQIPTPPVGEVNSYDDGLAQSLQNYPMHYYMCFSSYEQKVDICKLCNQLDMLPYGFTLPLSKKFQSEFITYLSSTNKKDINNDTTFNSWNGNLNVKNAITDLPFMRYWFNPRNQTIISNGMAGSIPINILPAKCYQHIFNDWFLDTQKNLPIDLFKSVIHRIDTAPPFFRSGSFNSQNSDVVPSAHHFVVQLYRAAENYFYNSLFSIRRPWYSKDYFNTSTNDPTLGVSPYAVGTSILDLRKNSALQRLAEKKALCGNKFIDFIVQHFNYYPPSLEIGRSIHLGTSVDYVSINTVLQTSQTTDSSAQGDRAATAQSYGRAKGVFFKAPTYGELMVLQCIKPEMDYYDGIPKEMTIVDAADMPLPELSQIGFDTIKSSELYVNPFLNSTDISFGYTPRYSWRKTRLNRIYGELCNGLNFWHQSPSLRFGTANNSYFGQIGFDTYKQMDTYGRYNDRTINPAYNRIFAITDLNEDTYVYQHNIHCTLNTCLPTNDSPQL